MHAGFRKLAFFAALSAATALSLQPHATVDAMYPPQVQAWDFAVHFAIYGALGALGAAAFVPAGTGAARRRLALALSLCCFGSLLELLQATPFVARSCSVSDQTWNSLGAAAGAFLLPGRLLLRKGPAGTDHRAA